MHRSVLSARPARFSTLVFRQQIRTFATPPIKDQSPPSPIQPSQEQAHPIGAYYESMLKNPQPIPSVKPEKPPSSASTSSPSSAQPAPSEPASEPASVRAKRGRKPKFAASSSSSVTKTTISSSLAPQSPAPDLREQWPEEQAEEPTSNTSASVQHRARLVFGSRIGGPAPPLRKITPTLSAGGGLVTPRPEEPDNCCMSGCVNCVWDAYRDEMEAWAAANAEVEVGMPAAEIAPADGGGRTGQKRSPGAGKIPKDFWDEELYKNVPVGIQEFMKQEKRLRLKHAQEGNLGV